MTSKISSQELVSYIKDMIQYNEFNYDYINDIIDYLSTIHTNDYIYDSILSLIYSNIKLFELIFINFHNEKLYIPGKIFNTSDSIVLIDMIKKNPDIKNINIDLCMTITEKDLSFLYVLDTLEDINIKLSILYSNIHNIFENKNFKSFIDKNIIYKLIINNCDYVYNCFGYLTYDNQDYINNLISNNKIIHIKYDNIYNIINKPKLINALSSNTSLKSFISNFTIDDELYPTFKEHNLLSSFIKYEVLYDYNTYHMYVDTRLNDENLSDLIYENKQKYIFNYIIICNRSLNDTFYNSLKNNTSITKIFFKKDTIDCKLLSNSLLNNNTINIIFFENCRLNNFNYMSDIFKYNKILTHLKINDSILSNYSSNEIFESLKNNDTLTSLDINSNSLKNEDIKNLAECLKYNSTLCDLKIVHYNYNPYVKEICNILQYNTTLTSLNFNYCSEYSYINGKYLNISIDESKQLAEALKNNTSLVSLNLKSLKTEFITPIIEALKSNKDLTSFKTPTYKLSRTLLDKRITDMLNYNTTLTDLDYT